MWMLTIHRTKYQLVARYIVVSNAGPIHSFKCSVFHFSNTASRPLLFIEIALPLPGISLTLMEYFKCKDYLFRKRLPDHLSYLHAMFSFHLERLKKMLSEKWTNLEFKFNMMRHLLRASQYGEHFISSNWWTSQMLQFNIKVQ